MNRLEKQTKQERTAVILLTAVTAVLAAVSTVFLVKRTGFASVWTGTEARRMAAELAAVFLVLFVTGRAPWKKGICRGIRIAVTVLYLWLHRILLPLLAAGLFIGYLYLLGGTLTGQLPAGRKAGAAGLITGTAAQIVIVCAFSAAGIGGTEFFLLQSGVCLAVLLAVNVIAARKGGRRLFYAEKTGISAGEGQSRCFGSGPEGTGSRTEGRGTEYGRTETVVFSLLTALIAAALLLQAGRIGVCLDYDSLHYGFRSAFVLDGGSGIYENLGSVNDVYVYPKGFEILTLPLAGFGSGAFVSAFSWWMTLFMLCGAAALTDRLNPRHKVPAGLFAAAVIAAMPGVMNMAGSAKTDAVTLAVQMACISGFLSKEKKDWWAGMAAAVLSLTMKPTAFLFSFLLAAAGLGLCVYRICRERKKTVRVPDFRCGIPLFFALLAVLLVTARTVRLAGVPLTTAGGSLWTALGFELRYPFQGASISGGAEKSYLKRLIGVFACPVGEDMSHVYIAWGGLSVPVCLAMTLIGAAAGKNTRNAEKTGLLAMLVLTAAASLCLLRTLWQVDGNYFMLLYVLAAVCAFTFTGRPSAVAEILSPAMLLGAAMCLATNWAGAVGLTPAGFLHPGYPEQQKEQQLRMEAGGKGEIYAFLARDPRTRVLAMAEQPGCFVFPCNVQSYTDLEGSGGNVRLVRTLNDFKDFLDYAGTDYIYAEQPFLDARERAAEIVRYMLEDGSLVEELSADGTGAVLYRYTGVR